MVADMKHSVYWKGINSTGTKCFVYSYEQKDSPSTWKLFVIDLVNDRIDPVVLIGKRNLMEYIASVAISPDGKYLALGTTLEIKSRELTEPLSKSLEVAQILMHTRTSGFADAGRRLKELGFINAYKISGSYVTLQDVSKSFEFQRQGMLTIFDLNKGEQVKNITSKWPRYGGGPEYTPEDHEHNRTRNLLFSNDSKILWVMSSNSGLFSLILGQNNRWDGYGNGPRYQDKKSKILYYKSPPSSPYYNVRQGNHWGTLYTGRVICLDTGGKYLLYQERDDNTSIWPIFKVDLE